VHKLVIVLRGRRDADELERRWSEDFVPLAEKMPGLRRVLVGRVIGSPAGGAETLLVHELLFDDFPSLQAAMTSPAGQAAGSALIQFAGERAELLFAEHLEMDLEHPTAAEAVDEEPA
jgi:uncharacterized protein (TIGR02118 family)